MADESTRATATLSEIQTRAIEEIVVGPKCFAPVAVAVSEFKSKVSGRHSLGPGPGSLFALTRKIVDPAFKEFIRAFPEMLSQHIPVLSELMRESQNANLVLSNLALMGHPRGSSPQLTLEEILNQPSIGKEFNSDEVIIVSTIDTLRSLITACGVFRPKQKRKFTHQGEGRKNNAREWEIKRSKVLADSKLDAIRSRVLSHSVYPYCRFCYRYCEHYQSQIVVRQTVDGMGGKVGVEFLPVRDDRSNRIRPDQSQEYCSLHREDRNARDRDRRMQPVYLALLVAMYRLKAEKIIQHLDEEELRKWAYEEARHRSLYAKKVASLLKQNPEISDEELGLALVESSLLNMRSN